jgi:thiol:disulfide interchange protein DsbD
MWAMSFLGFAIYLGVGLFGAEKPQGAIWKNVEALANSTFDVGTDRIGPYRKHGNLKYALDFKRALDIAIAENKPLFLDFTGVNCANCRAMEKGPMSQPAIEERLGQFVLTQLFTDSVPISDAAERERLLKFNVRLQEDWFGAVSLPSYAVIAPDPSVKDPGKMLAKLEGYNNEAAFARFLDDGLNGWKKVQASRAGKIVGQR